MKFPENIDNFCLIRYFDMKCSRDLNCILLALYVSENHAKLEVCIFRTLISNVNYV